MAQHHLGKNLVCIPLLLITSTVSAQVSDSYRRAAQAYRDAAANSSGSNKQCYLLYASYYDCLSTMSNSCNQPTCTIGADTSGTSAVGSSGISSGSSTNQQVQQLVNNTFGLIQQIMSDRAERKRQLEQGLLDKTERQAELDRLAKEHRETDAAALLRDSGDLLRSAGGIDCIALMSAYHTGPAPSLPPECITELERLSTYGPSGRAPDAPPAGPEEVIDGSKIPSTLDYTSILDSPPGNAPPAAASPGQQPSGSSQTSQDPEPSATSDQVSKDDQSSALSKLMDSVTPKSGQGSGSESSTPPNPGAGSNSRGPNATGTSTGAGTANGATSGSSNRPMAGPDPSDSASTDTSCDASSDSGEDPPSGAGIKKEDTATYSGSGPLRHWVEKVLGGWTIYIQNNRDSAVRVSGYTFNCVEASMCGNSSSAVLQPGTTMALAIITRAGCTNPVKIVCGRFVEVKGRCENRPDTHFEYRYTIGPV